MLVSIIILALVGVSTPLFRRTYHDLRLRSAAKEIASIVQLARERAVFERRQFRVVLDLDNKTYRLTAEDERGDLLPIRSRWGRRFKLPDSIGLESQTDYIDFFPNGRATPLLLYLAGRDDDIYTVEVEKASGFVNVYDYKKE